MKMKPLIALVVVALAASACSDETPESAGPDVTICRELSDTWEALLADESSETARRIGEALKTSSNAKAQEAGDLYLEFADYPRDADGNVTIDAAREHLQDRFVLIKTVAAGCTEIGVELSDEMREAAEVAEQMDGIPTPGESEANDPVIVEVGETALMEGEQSGHNAVEVTVAVPEQHTESPDGEQPEYDLFLVVDVHLVGVEGTYLFTNLTSFSFEAADGTVYYTGYYPSFGPEPESGSISEGQEASGTIVFDLPTDAIEGGKILLEGFGFDMTALPGAIWTLD